MFECTSPLYHCAAPTDHVIYCLLTAGVAVATFNEKSAAITEHLSELIKYPGNNGRASSAMQANSK